MTRPSHGRGPGFEPRSELFFGDILEKWLSLSIARIFNHNFGRYQSIDASKLVLQDTITVPGRAYRDIYTVFVIFLIIVRIRIAFDIDIVLFATWAGADCRTNRRRDEFGAWRPTP